MVCGVHLRIYLLPLWPQGSMKGATLEWVQPPNLKFSGSKMKGAERKLRCSYDSLFNSESVVSTSEFTSILCGHRAPWKQSSANGYNLQLQSSLVPK
ncbi:unnamed protein product [Orchesella dallaii]|uniref:Uncharacterized protein n=1 Tax=Orchesella dallaii TaxID=48710 RepID=A0ABP1PZX6_9HEXA